MTIVVELAYKNIAMKKRQLLFIAIGFIITSCSFQSSDNPKNWSKKKLAEWVRVGRWKSGWSVTPDESINTRELAMQIFKNKERWEKAFSFLKTNDLKNLKPGRYQLDGDSLFVNVNIYSTKNDEDACFESHRKYADIQYVVSGEEQIGIVHFQETEVLVPYDEAKDIVFLKAKRNNFRIANSRNFFVFFPDDAHCPNIKVEGMENVKKVVVKVKI